MLARNRLTLIAGLWLALSAGVGVRVASAVAYIETGDAGQTLATAQATGLNATTSLTSIVGTFNAATDADLFVITMTSPSTFSATTVNALTTASGLDTELFLFNANGSPVAENDDANGTTLASTLPAGNSLYATLAAGTYYLGISQSGYEPINASGQLLFAGAPGGDTTIVRGPAPGLNPTTESNFTVISPGGTTGSYEIDLTSAATAVPEPSGRVAMVGALLMLVVVLWRRRQRATGRGPLPGGWRVRS